MQRWIVKVEIVVEANDKDEAEARANEIIFRHQGVVLTSKKE